MATVCGCSLAMMDAGTEALVVVDDRYERRVLGLLSESHTLRRYSEELEKQRRDTIGALE